MAIPCFPANVFVALQQIRHAFSVHLCVPADTTYLRLSTLQSNEKECKGWAKVGQERRPAMQVRIVLVQSILTPMALKANIDRIERPLMT